MKRLVRRIIQKLFWRTIVERRQKELNREHKKRLGWYVNKWGNIELYI